jgi:type IV secretory pathway VirB10-like protein
MNRKFLLKQAVVVLAGAAFLNCDQRKESPAPPQPTPQTEAAPCEKAPPPEESQAAPAEESPPTEPAPQEKADLDRAPPAPVTEQGEKMVFRATGRVKRSRDISMARDAAAAQARQRLLILLKEKGYLPKDANELVGATIERYYFRGRYLYAVASLELEKGVNHSGEGASNKTEDSNGGKQ